MQRWKKGLFIGLFSSMLVEQQAVAAAVGLARPDSHHVRVETVIAEGEPAAAGNDAEQVALPDVVPSGPLELTPALELTTHAARDALLRAEEQARAEAEAIEQAKQAQQRLVLASRGDLPRPAVQAQQPERASAQQAQSNEAPTVMKKAGVSGMQQTGDPGALGSRAVTLALRYQGSPYQYGGTSPSGFDCSGFIQYVMREAGRELPRTTYEQLNAGAQVARANLLPGDLVFFACGGSPASHAGIYIGNGQFIHADQNRGIEVADLDRDYWASAFQGGVRLQ